MKISEAIIENAKKGRTKVAIGLVKTNPEIINSLYQAKKYADILVLGERIEDIECKYIPNQDGRESIIGREMVELLKSKHVDAIVKGNIDTGDYLFAATKLLNYDKILRVTILKDMFGNEFLLAPASVVEGNSVEERLKIAKGMAHFVKELGLEPKIAILQICDYPITEEIKQSIAGASCIVENLKRDGWKINFVGYAVEKAVETCNVIVPSNGIIGNAVWRSLVGFKAVHALGDFSLTREIIVDGSKFWNDYYQSIVFAAALVNMRKEL